MVLSKKDDTSLILKEAIGSQIEVPNHAESPCGTTRNRDPGMRSEHEIRIIDFILGQCDATHSKQFVDYWLVTNGSPCYICGNEKSTCSFFNALLERGALSKRGIPP